jgi:DNA-binding CsgD family transcriptional regulator
MKTKKIIKRLLDKDVNPKEIAEITNTSIQNVYKHIRSLNNEMPKNNDKIISLSNKTINTIVERLYEKISLDLQK